MGDPSLDDDGDHVDVAVRMKTCLTVRDKARIGEIDEIADARPSPTSRLWPKRPWVDDNPVLSQSGESPEW
jgi:hypothetical protein